MAQPLVGTSGFEWLLVGAWAGIGLRAPWLKGRSTRMVYRIGLYALILAVGLLAAMGFGLFTQVGQMGRQARSIITAAPVAADNSSSSDNSSSDNGSCSDNSSSVTTIVIVSTPTPQPTPKPAAPTPAPAAAAPAAPAAQGPCQFVLGFADLHRILSGKDGTCLENEHPDPNGSGDEVQATSLPSPNGLMVWNRFTNSMRWTDGLKTWTYSKCLLQERLNTETFAWEKNPNLLVPESAPIPAGACDKV
jgi:hypothetical protein